MAMDVRDDRKYSDDHEWVLGEGDEVTIGISAYAVEQLGDIVFVELPEAGATFAKGDTFGVVESAKAASDLFLPVSGEVVASNPALDDNPEMVNDDPFGTGWMVKVKLSDTSELGGLKDAAAYKEMIGDSA
jgi:glycine cleavage system H protein